MFACTGLAQAAPADQTTAGPNRGNKPCGCMAGKQMNAGSHLEMMTKCLGLTEDQQTKIKPLLEENFKLKQAVRADKNLTREQRRAKMQELRTQMHEKIQPILTPEQQSKCGAHMGCQAKQPMKGNCPLMK
jgi:Spy/CpxP family protein refolding chaperone